MAKIGTDSELRKYNRKKICLQFPEILKTKYSTLDSGTKILIKQKLIIIQNGRCAICEKYIDLTTAHLDHNHINGYLRGLLCCSCNTALGLLADNKELFIRAIKYITRKLEII